MQANTDFSKLKLFDPTIYVTAADLAKAVDKSVSCVYKTIKDGNLRAVKYKGRWLIPVRESVTEQFSMEPVKIGETDG